MHIPRDESPITSQYPVSISSFDRALLFRTVVVPFARQIREQSGFALVGMLKAHKRTCGWRFL